MNKYYLLQASLIERGEGKLTVFGNSMLPILQSGSTLMFQKQLDYEVGDIVCCKISGRIIDAHKIIKKDTTQGYLIANNHGHENGWTQKVFGKVIYAKHKGKIIYTSFPQLRELFERGVEVFCTVNLFEKWLESTPPYFKGKRPKDFIFTDIQMLFDEVGRIEYGIVS